MKIDQEMIEKIRKAYMEEMTKDILDVQSMPNIDFTKIAEHPLWHSFVERHIKK